MSPQSGDDTPSSDPTRPSGLANVLRGLTNSKSTKSPSPLLSSSSPGAVVSRTDSVNARPTPARMLSANHRDAFEQLRNGSPNERIEAAHSLRFAITDYPLNPVLDIWYAAKDLIDPAKTTAARTAGWELLTECAKHTSSTNLERKEYFQTLSAPANPEDFHLQLAAVVDLTNRGRDLTGFDYELIPLLTDWLRESYSVARVARRSASHSSRANTKSPTKAKAGGWGEDKNLAQLFTFIIDVTKFSFNCADEASLTGLIAALLDICMNTSNEDDLRSCISVINAILTFGYIPDTKLKDCTQVLSSIYCLVISLQKDSWHVLSHLCKSHSGQAIVRILLDILRDLPAQSVVDKDVSREARGSLAVLQKLLSKGAENGYPPVPYALLVDGLRNTVQASSSAKVHGAVLELINAMFDGGEGQLSRLVVDEDWNAPLDVAAKCFKRTQGSDVDHQARSQQREDDSPDVIIERQVLALVARLNVLMVKNSGDFIPRHTIVKFLTQVHPLLPDGTVRTVLDYFQEFRCCSPSDLHWEENAALVLKAFFGDRSRASQTRLRALQTIKDTYEIVDLVGDGGEQNFIPRLAKNILQDLAHETDTSVLDAVMALMVSIAMSSDMNLFTHIADELGSLAVDDELRSPIVSPSMPGTFSPNGANDADLYSKQSPLNVVTKGLVRMFLQTMNMHCAKSVKVFNALVNIARSKHCEDDARLTAMKLLFRLRADWADRVFVVSTLETDCLAATICRTEASLSKKQADEAAQTLRLSRSEHGAPSRTSRGISFGQGQMNEKGLPVRSLSGAHNTRARYHQAWKLPDPDALPGDVSTLSSSVLSSRAPSTEVHDNDDAIMDLRPGSLNMAIWLKAVLGMLQGSDWEVYSFVLVHLPSQLSNHAVFKGAIPQIQELRRIICEQIRTNGFREPPSATGLRRADVAICLYESLTMILSYHEHFQKSDEDEIVRIFVHGISTWERSAKCCIHALSICCHELPLSTSRSLVQMLNQMAAIITQPHVSIHVLEFLACLSRLPHIYVNFREDEYRIVFAICFRYLDYAREKKQSKRSTYASESSTPATPSSGVPEQSNSNASEDLPQYVHALAYHVILFWFLALKLHDRHTHVGWIVKQLFADADGADQTADEQAVTSIDFLQRVTYTDTDESAEDVRFTEDRYGEITERRWLMGNCIVTVKQAVATGMAQIIKRQPSGTSAYMVHTSGDPPPPYQVANNVDITRDGRSTANAILPSHMLVQLLSPIPQAFESIRPIPLAEDEATERTIKIFDRHSAVDGHKVGVIYIGDGQTKEAEILANSSGSTDYVEFLHGLGTLTRLKGAKFNTQGLDREYDLDGNYTFCWRDRVTEIVFHVTTQMPTQANDPSGDLKKRHIGNDFVNIIFNDSGLPFRFDTFPSQFNFVNIVITPASLATFIATRNQDEQHPQGQPFYRVQVMSKPGFPDISPASDMKMVSLKALPGFIRLLALNASMFSLVWSNREGGEHISSWSGRLREIKRLRERHGPKAPPPKSAGGATAAAAPPPQPDTSRPSSTVRDSFNLRRTSIATFFTNTSEQNSHRSSTLSTSTTTNDTEVGAANGAGSLVESVDFSKWA